MSDAQGIFIIVEVVASIILVVSGYIIGRRNQGGGLSRKIGKHHQAVIDKGCQDLEATIAEQDVLLREELHQTALTMNSYMKDSLSRTLQDETKQYRLSLSKVRQTGVAAILQSQAKIDKQNAVLKDQYETSLSEVRQFALDSIQRSQAKVEQQNAKLRDQLAKDFVVEKQRRITQFEENMTDVISYYVQTAVGDRLEVNAQLPIILADLQATKTAMLEDITRGA